MSSSILKFKTHEVPLAAATNAEKVKQKKYAGKLRGDQFLACAIEAHGSFGKQAGQLLSQIAAEAERNKNVLKETFTERWSKVISCALQTGNAIMQSEGALTLQQSHWLRRSKRVDERTRSYAHRSNRRAQEPWDVSDGESEEEDSGPFTNAQEEIAHDSELSQDGAVADTNENIPSTTASQPSSSSSSVSSDQQVNSNIEFIVSMGKERSRSSLNTASASRSASLSSSLLSRVASREEAADAAASRSVMEAEEEDAVDESHRSLEVAITRSSLRTRSGGSCHFTTRSFATEVGSRASSNPS